MLPEGRYDLVLQHSVYIINKKQGLIKRDVTDLTLTLWHHDILHRSSCGNCSDCVVSPGWYQGANIIPTCSPFSLRFMGWKAIWGSLHQLFLLVGAGGGTDGCRTLHGVYLTASPAKLIDDKWKEAAVDTTRHRNKKAVYLEWTFCQ